MGLHRQWSGLSWNETNIPDQTGRVALVTGGNGGLGVETCRALAAKGAHIIMAARNQGKAAAARAGVIDRSPKADIVVKQLDLGSLDSVNSFTSAVLADYDRVDILINNAGVMGIPEQRTADGFEMQFGVNHLGHHALTALVYPLLVNTPGSRVVSITSTGRHYGKPVDLANPHLDGVYTPWRSYGQAKLANLHFALGLEQRFRAAGAQTQSLVAHPGLSHTDLQANSVRETGGGWSQRFWDWLASHTGMSPERAVLPQLRAATDPTACGGELYAPRFVNRGPPVRRPLVGRSTNQRSIDTLFAVSERETGLSIQP